MEVLHDKLMKQLTSEREILLRTTKGDCSWGYEEGGEREIRGEVGERER